MFVGQKLQISTKFMHGKVIFTWTPSNYSKYDVLITRDTADDDWARVSDTEYTVRDVLRYNTITINVRILGSTTDNKLEYNGIISLFALIIYSLKYNSMTFNVSIFG